MTDQEMNRMTRFAAPFGAVAIVAAVALGTFAAMAQAPQPPASPSVPGTATPGAAGAPATNTPASTGSQGPGASAKPESAAKTGTQTTSMLVGLQVVDKAGEVVGSVSKVEQFPNGDIRTVEISTGGFLGIGVKTLRVPADKIARSGQKVVLMLARDQIKTMTH